MKDAVASEVVKIAPPAAVAAWSWLGHTVNEWVAVGTLIYLAFAIAHIVWQWIKPFK